MKRILIVCGAGIATSTMVKDKVEKFLAEKNLTAQVKTSTIASFKDHLPQTDILVTTTKFNYTIDIPLLKGVCLLTGIGENTFYESLLELL